MRTLIAALFLACGPAPLLAPGRYEVALHYTESTWPSYTELSAAWWNISEKEGKYSLAVVNTNSIYRGHEKNYSVVFDQSSEACNFLEVHITLTPNGYDGFTGNGSSYFLSCQNFILSETVEMRGFLVE